MTMFIGKINLFLLFPLCSLLIPLQWPHPIVHSISKILAYTLVCVAIYLDIQKTITSRRQSVFVNLSDCPALIKWDPIIAT
jgi:hypothetical protein